jgi:hypothetical protein
MYERLSEAVVAILQRVGWYEGRDVSSSFTLPSQPPIFPRAQEAIAEFGGLHFGSCGPGIERATSDVNIDPNLATHLASELEGLGKSLQTKLFPLGEVHRGHGYLVIDEQGRTYLLSANLSPFASNLSQCLELLLLGKKPSPQEIEATWPGIGREKGPG